MADQVTGTGPRPATWLSVDPAGATALRAARCGTCGRRHLPARDRCPWCGSDELAPELRSSGTVVAATTTMLPVPGTAGPFHSVVLVDLGDDLVAAGQADEELEPGTLVAVAPVAIGSGDEAVIAHSFVRADREDNAHA